MKNIKMSVEQLQLLQEVIDTYLEKQDNFELFLMSDMISDVINTEEDVLFDFTA